MDKIWRQYQSIEKAIGDSMRIKNGLLRAVELPLIRIPEMPLGARLEFSAHLLPRFDSTIRMYDDLNRAFCSRFEGVIQSTALGTQLQQGLLASRILEEQQTWVTLAQRVASSPLERIARESQLNWMQTVSRIAEQLSLWAPVSVGSLHMDGLLAPAQYLGEFSRRTLEALQRASGSQSIGLQSSLAVAQYELSGLPSLMGPLFEDVDPGEGCVLATVRMNAGRVWRRELVTAATERNVVTASDEAIQQLVDSSSGVDLTGRIRHMLSLIPQCNEAAKCAGRPEIFKLSNHMVAFMCSAHVDLATNRERLTSFIINTCIVIYEAGGKGKHNYRDKGLLSKEESRIVDVICDLRNGWLAHDPEQGGEGAEVHNYRKVRQSLRSLGIDRFPTRALHFMQIQRAIVDRCIEMLETLLERVAAFPPPNGTPNLYK